MNDFCVNSDLPPKEKGKAGIKIMLLFSLLFNGSFFYWLFGFYRFFWGVNFWLDFFVNFLVGFIHGSSMCFMGVLIFKLFNGDLLVATKFFADSINLHPFFYGKKDTGPHFRLNPQIKIF
jgi:hypothetical protein